MAAFVIAVIIASGVVGGGWYVDQRLVGSSTPLRAMLTLTLLGIAVWLMSLIQAAIWLRTPGAYGPVQYWTDGPGGGLDFMMVRALAMFVLLIGLPLAVAVPMATIASLYGGSSGQRWRLCVVPALALVLYGVAYQMFFEYRFFPSA